MEGNWVFDMQVLLSDMRKKAVRDALVCRHFFCISGSET